MSSPAPAKAYAPIVVPFIQNTPEWLEWRATGGKGNPYPCGIGGSDASIIMGVSRFKNVDQLWLEKSGLADPTPGNFITDLGHQAEPYARALYESEYGIKTNAVCLVHGDMPELTASLDGVDPTFTIAQEIKLHGAEYHARVCADEVPDEHVPQLQHNLNVSGAQLMHLISFSIAEMRAGALPYGKIAVTHVLPDEEYIARLVDVEHEFLRCVVDGVRPSTTPTFSGRTVVAPGWANTAPKTAPATALPAPVAVVPPLPAPLPAPDAPSAVQGVSGRDAVVVVQTLAPESKSITLAPEFIAQRDEWISAVNALVVDGQPTADHGAALLRSETKFRKEIEKQGKALAEPYKSAVAAIKGAVEEALAPLLPADALLKEKLAAWELAKQEAQRKAQAEAAAAAAENRKRQEEAVDRAAKTGELSLAPQLPVVAPPKVQKTVGMAVTKTPRHEITDPARVPMEFWSIDPAKVAARVKMLVDPETWGEPRREVLPGVVAWVETSVKSTGR